MGIPNDPTVQFTLLVISVLAIILVANLIYDIFDDKGEK
jgi:hypothetical protein